MNGGWDDITKAELTELAKELTDRMIADKYGVTVGQVRYKRKKYGITMYDLACQAALQEGIVGRRNIKASAWGGLRKRRRRGYRRNPFMRKQNPGAGFLRKRFSDAPAALDSLLRSRRYAEPFDAGNLQRKMAR